MKYSLGLPQSITCSPMVNIALFGPPGSGKGTQSALLQEVYKLTHIAPGNIFRTEVQEGTALGLELQSYIDRGNLVPEELTMQIIGRKMMEVGRDSHLLLDGYPRSLAQARALQGKLEEIKRPLDLVLFLDVRQEEVRQRIALRGRQLARADDQSETILNHRLNVYENLTLPVARYYDEQKKLVRIDGMGSIDEVQKRISAVIEAYVSDKTS